jgi:serine/threonine protein kinase
MFRPTTFGKYHLYERIAIGGMAEIFLAKMYGVDGFEKKMVVKQILPQYSRNKEFIQMFVDEAKLTVSLSHGNIVPVYELGQINSVYFIAMEHIDGKNLGEVMDTGIDRNMRFSIPHALFIATEVLSGLDYAHRKTDDQGRQLNIVHRDVSPQNILISFDGEVKIVDFGIARAATSVHQTQSGVIKGKFGYMAPEQVLGQQVDSRSDIFAAGILLFEMLTFQRLFHASSEAIALEKIKNADVPTPSKINSGISPMLDAIVFRSLARLPEDRYPTAVEMKTDLSKALYSSYSEKGGAFPEYMQNLFTKELQMRKTKSMVPSPDPGTHKDPTSASGPESLFEDSAVDAPGRMQHPDEYEKIEDDFSYIKASHRIKKLVLMGLLAAVILGIGLFWSQLSMVFREVGQVIDESSERLAEKKLGTLYVRSQPKGASVYFSNRKVGTTDIRIGSIDPAREYELVLTHEGFQPFSKRILPSDWNQNEEKMEIQIFKNFTKDSLK